MLISKVNDMLQIVPFSYEFSNWFAILSIKEFVRTYVCEVPIGFQEAEPSLDEDNVKVVVAFGRAFVFILIEFDKLWIFLFECLDADVGWVADHDVETAFNFLHA